MLNLLRTKLYKGACNLNCELPDMTVLQLNDIYHGMPRDVAPLITTMGITGDIPLVESIFGKVQEGSVLSYHLPALSPPRTCLPASAPSRPALPLDGIPCAPRCNEMPRGVAGDKRYCLRLRAMLIRVLGDVTRPKLPHEREICHVRGQSTAESLAARILRPGQQTAETKRGLDMEPKAVEEYCQAKDVNHYPCGFIIHPDAPWLGSSPDGLVYDPKGEPVFGLLKVKNAGLYTLQGTQLSTKKPLSTIIAESGLGELADS
ncbi:hypothetical protein N1851_000466 [Merluccius polli]|uniref:YqaJ viral recombinase domain-containing protein n=1 Tax=Merluccius polli TaxID=89951 RepID=A0AA47ND36_MERPO|nr:hypothetical protein N1851_000466 [Merluccius polli]